MFVIFIFRVSWRIKGELGKSCRCFVSCSVFKLASRACILSLSCTSALWRKQEEQNKFSIKCNWKTTCLFMDIFSSETKIKMTWACLLVWLASFRWVLNTFQTSLNQIRQSGSVSGILFCFSESNGCQVLLFNSGFLLSLVMSFKTTFLSCIVKWFPSIVHLFFQTICPMQGGRDTGAYPSFSGNTLDQGSLNLLSCRV